jgi:phosphatidylglycerol lysyltransferase
VLGDPVCDPSQGAALIDRFIAAHGKPMFCQVSQPIAEILHERGYWINTMGIDTTLNLADYDFAGKKKEWLRYAGNWIDRRGYQIIEASFAEVTADCVAEISEAWRQTRVINQKEVRFLNRPIMLTDEPDVRKFFLRDPDGQLLAFVFLDPLYRDGKIIGYATAFKRRHPAAPQYAEQAIMKHIIETLQLESVEQLSLGLSPLASLGDRSSSPFRSSWTTHWLFEKTFASRKANRWYYNVAGHADYKRRFYGTEHPCYLAMPTRFSPRRLAALVGLCGIV